MSEQQQTEATPEGEAPRTGGQITDGFERVWTEIKQIGKQVERETRKSGRVARLRLDIRGLEREVREVRERLGKAVYAARQEQGDEIALSEVEGYAGGVAALDALAEQIADKEAEIERLRAAALGEAPAEADAEAPAATEETPEEVA